MIRSLFIYPIKSLQGIEVDQLQLTDRGPRGDRRYMLIDENGKFMTQRTLPEMALFRTRLYEQGFAVAHSDAGEMVFPFEGQKGERVQTKVWDDSVEVLTTSAEANAFFSRALQRTCQLVYMPDHSLRPTDARFAEGKLTSLADGYPYLLIGTASLDALNARLPQSVSMQRFRPNIIVDTTTPFEEDHWKRFKLGNISFENVKPCSRCILVNVDPTTGTRSQEPLRTLAQFRSHENKVYFGVNVVSTSTDGLLRVGEALVL